MPALPWNILYIHSHDTGRFVQPYGYAVQTPNIQRLAEEGVLFRHAFSAAPTCSPSRAALLTGQYPHCCGMHGLASPKWGYTITDSRHLLPNFLAAHGYETAIVGVQHVSIPTPAAIREQGFRRILQEHDCGEDVADTETRAGAFIEERHDKPWFLSVGFDETHRDSKMGDEYSGTRFSKYAPYKIESLESDYCRPPALYPDRPEIRRDFASFQAGVRRLDERVGAVLASLDRSGQRDRTLVILTTDHGLAWPGMKGTLSDLGVGVMLLLCGPAPFHRGIVVDTMVSQMDIFPTLCETLSLRAPDWLQGKSLVPLCRGTVHQVHDALFFEHGWHEVADPQRAIRTTRFKLVRRYGELRRLAANCDESPTKRVLKNLGWFDQKLPAEEFFDLSLDPMEQRGDIVREGDNPMRQELRDGLENWMRQTGDPLLTGIPVPPPAQNAGSPSS